MGCEHPDWLPVGWRVCLRVRSCGKKDKYYVNPSNGLKFNSKPEVLRYLKYSAKGQKPRVLKNKVEIRTTVADKLPPGWIKEIRTTKKGRKTRRDPYYIDPVTGRYFRSMQEVFRYLESKDSKAESKPDSNSHISRELGDHPQSSSAEAKRQRSMDKKAEKNLTGHESVKSGLKLAGGLKPAATNIMNTPEEDNHLERKGEDDSLAIELSDKLQLVNRAKQHADRTTEIKKLVGEKVGKSADGDRRFKSGSEVGPEKKVDIPEAKVVEQLKKKSDSAAGSLLNQLAQVNRTEDVKYRRRQSKRLADSKPKDNIGKDQSVQSGPEDAGEKNVEMPETIGFEQKEKENGYMGEEQQHESLPRQTKRKNSSSKGTSDLPRRTSKRLARVEVDPSLEVKTSDKAGDEAALSGEPEVNTSISVKAGPSDEPDVDTTGKFDRCNNPKELPSKCKAENPTDNEQKEPVIQRNLSSLKEHKDVGVDCKEENKDDEKHLDSALKDLLKDPCIEFAVKTLTGAIPIEDVNKLSESPVSSLASPNQTSSSSPMLQSGDIWADPCFEFAVKMLTSEMPAEDGSQCRVSFQQPLSSSGAGGCNSLTVPEFRLDNVYPSVYSSVSQLNAVKIPCMRQQGMRDCPPPPPPHGGSQNFVGRRNGGVEGRKRNFM
ncbi:Methyl-CpG-binding domain-containing protein 13 [Sesamum alatum]|uniref:Methyl-CpG-binding domain-containing protein 13 n=1 Tax=Sesamum alatum TaxID=300844 RepID=A0AAE2CR63_9LAMI|nr:Methyl-CpG-binding domain-containing protein 13 [Sesamum alatum]